MKAKRSAPAHSSIPFVATPPTPDYALRRFTGPAPDLGEILWLHHGVYHDAILTRDRPACRCYQVRIAFVGERVSDEDFDARDVDHVR